MVSSQIARRDFGEFDHIHYRLSIYRDRREGDRHGQYRQIQNSFSH